MASFSMGGIYPFPVAKAAHNLPFIHACYVLDKALYALYLEGKFSCERKSKNEKWRPFLGELLKASKKVLPWADYTLIQSAINDRNGIAHRGELLEQEACWKYIDAIRSELRNWRILV